MSENDAQRRRQLFDEYRKQAWDDIRSGTDSFDRNLLAVSSSALALSLAFIKDFTPLATAVSLPFLYTSWCCFAGTIVTTIFSFRLSIAAVNKHLEYAYKYYEENDEKFLKKKSAAEIALGAFTWIAAILFLAGVFSTVIFCISNVRDKVKDNPKKTVNTVAREFAKDGRSPLSLTPVPKPETLEKGRKPAALTPVPGGTEERGRQPAAITPVPTTTTQPATNQASGSGSPTGASNTGTPATTDKK